ncbi:hypothetical protein MMPV_009445 [Pyropia vietnamensis]
MEEWKDWTVGDVRKMSKRDAQSTASLMRQVAHDNRMIAYQRIEDRGWHVPPGFNDVLGGSVRNPVGRTLESVHGAADHGLPGIERETMQGLALCNELLLYETSQSTPRFLLYLAGLCTVHPAKADGRAFTQAAIIFGRIRHEWPSAVYVDRLTLPHVELPWVEDKQTLNYLMTVEMLLTREPEPLPLCNPPRADWDYMCAEGNLPTPGRLSATKATRAVGVCRSSGFLAPFWIAWIIEHKNYCDSRGLLAPLPVWATDMGAGRNPPWPKWVTYFYQRMAARAPRDDDPEAPVSILWSIFLVEYTMAAAAIWFDRLTRIGLLHRMPRQVQENLVRLDIDSMTRGGSAMAPSVPQATALHFAKAREGALQVPWDQLEKDIESRDRATGAATAVQVHVDAEATYGFELLHAVENFPVHAHETTDEDAELGPDNGEDGTDAPPSHGADRDSPRPSDVDGEEEEAVPTSPKETGAGDNTTRPTTPTTEKDVDQGAPVDSGAAEQEGDGDVPKDSSTAANEGNKEVPAGGETTTTNASTTDTPANDSTTAVDKGNMDTPIGDGETRRETNKEPPGSEDLPGGENNPSSKDASLVTSMEDMFHPHDVRQLYDWVIPPESVGVSMNRTWAELRQESQRGLARLDWIPTNRACHGLTEELRRFYSRSLVFERFAAILREEIRIGRGDDGYYRAPHPESLDRRRPATHGPPGASSSKRRRHH